MRLVACAVVAWSAVCLAAEQAAGPQLVEMTAADGTKLTAKLWGKGHTGLVLCHGRMYTRGADSFAAECGYLASKGLMCLALNFRRYPCDRPPDLSAEERKQDLVAAFGSLAMRGARRIFVLGSSMGGFSVFDALDTLAAQPQFAGSIILSAVSAKAWGSGIQPKLLFVAQDDPRLYRHATAMFALAAPPKQGVFFRTGGHGQQLFRAHGREILDHILLFVSKGAEE